MKKTAVPLSGAVDKKARTYRAFLFKQNLVKSDLTKFSMAGIIKYGLPETSVSQ